MIIKYKIPFSCCRKVARTYCKIIQSVKSPFAKRRLLKHLDGMDIDYRDIPVIINNFNRIDYLKKLIDWLEKAEMRNIYIIDNASTYPILLDYYSQTKHTVIRLEANIGYKALWDTSVHLWFKGLPYIYTDPDILPIEECPYDAVKYFQEILNEYAHINKVGFGLNINDLPDHYPNKPEVLKWEGIYWEDPISENLYKADIDTTFALYRAHSVKQQWGKTIRTGGKYMARHLPWYENPKTITEEELYYRKMTMGSSWYTKHKV
jgi:hypothetical protein